GVQRGRDRGPGAAASRRPLGRRCRRGGVAALLRHCPAHRAPRALRRGRPRLGPRRAGAPIRHLGGRGRRRGGRRPRAGRRLDRAALPRPGVARAGDRRPVRRAGPQSAALGSAAVDLPGQRASPALLRAARVRRRRADRRVGQRGTRARRPLRLAPL
ncbi:MAG: FIG01124367: hypothetical protein, partial [uncultured Blastococcus sp.]